MKIGLIDNELITRKGHHFPNLAIMKLSAYHKKQGDDVRLINFDMINPNNLFTDHFDIVYVSKVFSDTQTPEFINNLPFVKKGGSGFFYDLAEKLPNEIEHTKPDYELYDNKIISKYVPANRTHYYTKFSIGFTTRGCIRKCDFCINKNEKTVYKHSDLAEFIDDTRPFIMLLDDNITAYKYFKDVFSQLNETNKPFVFKQGMDFRLLNREKMDMIFHSNYYSGLTKNIGARVFHFAFDNIKDKELIEKNLQICYNSRTYAFKMFFYVLCGFDRDYLYDESFYIKDLSDLIERITILSKYYAYPYIMLHENYKNSPYKYIYDDLKKICNNPMFITNKNIYKALSLSGLHNTINFLEKQYPEFLQITFNTKMKPII